MPLTMDIAHPNWTQWPVVRSILCVVPLYRAHFYANANADCGRGYKNLCPKYFMIFPKKKFAKYGHMQKNMAKWVIPEKSIQNAAQRR